MARYVPRIGPFDFTFDRTFDNLASMVGWQGGQFSAIFDDSFSKRPFFQGAIGGNVFQVSGRTFAIRAHTIPTLKKTNLQLDNRSIFRGNISRYQSTTNLQKDTWESAKFNYPIAINSGNTRFRNRYHLFMSSNQNWSYSNQANKLTIGDKAPPLTFFVTTAIYAIGAGTFIVSFVSNSVPNGYAMQLFTSRVLAPGDISAQRASLRLTRILSPGQTLPIDIFSDYSEVWSVGSITAGQQILIGIRLIPTSDGQMVGEIGAVAQIVS